MDQKTWTTVDDYFTERLIGKDEALDAALEASAAAGLPAINVSPTQGKLLMLLAQMSGARSILEIGTLGGYSTIWLARALPSDGTIFSLEIDPARAELARKNLARAGFASVAEVRVGPALTSLDALIAAGDRAFDFIFIDADKRSTPDYLERSLRLATPGAVILVDNVVRRGAVADPGTTDADVLGIQRFIERVAQHRVSGTAIQTVGGKGYDGLFIARVADR